MKPMPNLPGSSSVAQRDIVVVDYPFTDFRGEKRRPALVVSNDEYNKGLDFIAVSITSTEYRTAVALGSESFIRTDIVQTFDKSLLRNVIGTVSEEIFAQVKERILKNC